MTNPPVKPHEQPTSQDGRILEPEVELIVPSIQPILILTKMECRMDGKFNIVAGLDKHSMVEMTGHLTRQTRPMPMMMQMEMGCQISVNINGNKSDYSF